MSKDQVSTKVNIFRDYLKHGFSTEEKTLATLLNMDSGLVEYGEVLNINGVIKEIDIIFTVEFKRNRKVVFLIECKNPSVNWYFPTPKNLPGNQASFATAIIGKPPLKIRKTPYDVVRGVWSDFKIGTGSKDDTVNSFVYNMIQVLEMRIAKELESPVKHDMIMYIPLIVTSAQLMTVDCSNSITRQDFEALSEREQIVCAEGAIEVNAVEWVYYNTTHKPQLNLDSDLTGETTVAVVTQASLEKFINETLQRIYWPKP